MNLYLFLLTNKESLEPYKTGEINFQLTQEKCLMRLLLRELLEQRPLLPTVKCFRFSQFVYFTELLLNMKLEWKVV